MNQKAEAHSDKKQRSLRWMMWMLFGLGLLLRLLKIQSIGFTVDELEVMHQLKELGWWKFLGQPNSGIDNHPPLTATLLALWMHVVPPIEILIRLPFVLFSAMGVIFAYKVFGNWFSRRTALLVCAFIACGNLPVLYGIYARPYGLGLSLLLFSLYQWDRVFNRNKSVPISRGFALGLSILALFYTHYPSYFVALALCVFSVFFLKRNNRRAYFLAFGLATVGTLPYVHLSLQHAKEMHIGPNGWEVINGSWQNYFQIFAEALNRSRVIGLMLIVLLGLGFFSGTERSKKRTKYLRIPSGKLASLCLALVFSTLFLYIGSAWYHGRWVLHQSMLLPLFPFVLGAMLHLGNPWFRRVKPAFFLGFAGILAYSTLFQNQIFKTSPFLNIRPIERFIDSQPGEEVVVLIQFPEAVTEHLRPQSPRELAVLHNPSDCRALDSLRSVHFSNLKESFSLIHYISSIKTFKALCSLPLRGYHKQDAVNNLNFGWNFYTFKRNLANKIRAIYMDTAFSGKSDFQWTIVEGKCPGENKKGRYLLHFQVQLKSKKPTYGFFSVGVNPFMEHRVQLVHELGFSLPRDRLISFSLETKPLQCRTKHPLNIQWNFGPLQDTIEFQVQVEWLHLQELYNKP